MQATCKVTALHVSQENICLLKNYFDHYIYLTNMFTPVQHVPLLSKKNLQASVKTLQILFFLILTLNFSNPLFLQCCAPEHVHSAIDKTELQV